mmetsp:Transcript_50346/g.89025  ORF Transcript_50346/g.89025 Transcript_50346/m.89025 type:complete len:98 (+) Transcript_50346:64-357(+)
MVRCVDHLLHYMAHVVEQNSRVGVKDLDISADEMKSFFAERKKVRLEMRERIDLFTETRHSSQQRRAWHLKKAIPEISPRARSQLRCSRSAVSFWTC